MTTSFLHPISTGWYAADASVGGPNYDEFVDDRAVESAIAARPDSVVALELPDRTAQARDRGLTFTQSLPLAAQHLAAMKAAGLYTPVTDALFAYEIREPSGHVMRALLGLVRSDEFSDGAHQPGRILRNEDVSDVKVEERRQHIDAMRHLFSAVLVVPALEQQRFDEELSLAFDGLGSPPVVADTDERGAVHRLWVLPETEFERVRPVLDDNRFLVADGNHRSRAAQQSTSAWCMVVVASASGLRIEPYSRLLRVPDWDEQAIRRRIAATGIRLAPAAQPGPDQDAVGDNYLYAPGSWYRVDLSIPSSHRIVDTLPHAVVEQKVFGQALHLNPSASEIQYVGGRSGQDYLVHEVDAGAASVAVVLRPVTMAEFTDINAARQRMPRKSTWFMPKARAGLVVAQVT